MPWLGLGSAFPHPSLGLVLPRSVVIRTPLNHDL